MDTTSITNPRRLLPAATFHMPTEPCCYVRGCYGETVVGALHPIFGRVVACASHDLVRYGVAKLFAPAPPLPARGSWGSDDSNPRGGKPEPRIPFIPRPPSPSQAVRPF